MAVPCSKSNFNVAVVPDGMVRLDTWEVSVSEADGGAAAPLQTVLFPSLKRLPYSPHQLSETHCNQMMQYYSRKEIEPNVYPRPLPSDC